MPLAGRDADVKVTSLVGTTSTGEAATASTAGGFVQVDDPLKRHIDPDSTPILYLNSTAVSSTAYTVHHVQGKFVWNTTGLSTGTYEADIEYLSATAVAGGREWALNIEADMFEVSTFGSAGWKEYQPNLNGATLSIGRYWTDPTFIDYMGADARFVVELLPLNAGSSSARYEGFARVVSDNPQASVDAIVSETINLVIDGQLHYST